MGMGTIVLVAALAMLLLLAAVFTIGSLVSIRQLDAELAKLRAAGQPVTAADLDALYAFPPKERDTTELWLGAFAVLDSPAYGNDAADLPDVGEGGAVPPPGEPWPQLEAAEAFLAKYRDPLAKMHRASEPGGEARFPLTFSAGDGAVASALLPHIQHVRGAVRLLKLESEVHIRRNDPHAAAESVRAIFAAARSFERQPLFVSQLVRVAMNGVACSQIERFLPASDFPEQDLLAFDRDLAAIDEAAALRRALLGTRAMGIGQFEDPSILGPHASPTRRWRPLRNIDELAYLKLMEKLVAASQSRRLPLRDAIMQAEEETEAFRSSSTARWRCPITYLTMPSWQALINAVCRTQARQAAARSAIAIERYRRVHGEAPEGLDQLVPDVLDQPPVDPFDGAPLRYRVDSGGYKVYSIGSDGVDQGGESGEGGQELDIVFEIPFERQKRD